MTIQQKVQIYNALLAGLSKGVKLAAELDRKRKTAERKKVEARNDELAAQAAKLRVKIHKNWTSQAQKVIDQIRQTNSRLQERLRDIQETIKKAEKFVKALGYIDDLIDIAKKVIAAMS